jgi:Fe-S oxidoreductase
MLPIMAKAPKVVNAAIKQPWVQSLTEKTVGYVDTPLMSVPTLASRIDKSHKFDLQQLAGLSKDERRNHVLIVQDPFTSYYDAEVVADFMALVSKLGKTPILLPFKPNGKAQHIKGFLQQFASSAKTTSTFLSMVSDLDIPLVGVDPALVLCYRDEYTEVLGKERGEFDVLTVHEWMLPRLSEFKRDSSDTDNPWYLLAHCTEKTKMPNAEKEWGAIFTHFGSVLNTVPVGCCGMAGTFGHEKDKLEMSKDIYQLSWKPRLEELPADRCLVTGYSCRSQVKRFEQEKVKHPLQALLELV